MPAAEGLATVDLGLADPGVSSTQIAAPLTENADTPHALLIAGLLKRKPVETAEAAERVVPARTFLSQLL